MHRNLVSIRTEWATRADDLLQVLNETHATVIHFSGHGSKTGGIALEDHDGKTKLVSGKLLAKLFAAVGHNVRLVVLNACESEEQASAIVGQVGCVVAMNDSIDDEAAVSFTASFYRALAFGKDVQNAFEQGLVSIGMSESPDDDVPRLLTRDDVNPSELVLVNPRSARRQ